jgi:hypothetical protein
MKTAKVLLIGCAMALATGIAVAGCSKRGLKDCYGVTIYSVVNSTGGLDPDFVPKVIKVTKEGNPATAEDRKAIAELRAHIKSKPGTLLKVDQPTGQGLSRVPDRVVVATQSKQDRIKTDLSKPAKQINRDSVIAP